MGQTIATSKSNAVAGATFRRVIRMGIVTVSASAMMFLAVAGSASTAKAADTGESLFKANCVVCHGDDGRGSAVGKSLGVPDLHVKVTTMTDAQIATQIENGKGNMPPFKSSLDHEKVEKIVAYVRTFGKKK
jgi:cbb3-type cytochrome c oxidase subunit III